MCVWFLYQEDALEEGMAAHCSILAWRIPWTEEPGRIQSMGSQRIRPDWSNLLRTRAHTHTHTQKNYFVLISRNWKIFFTGFILSDDQLVYLRGKFAISKDAEFNPKVFLTTLLGGVISTIGSTLFHIQLNRQNSGLSELGIKSK